MIGPEEIWQWADLLWPDYLRAVIDGRGFFPRRRDRLGRVPASEDPAQFAAAVTPLWEGSKQQRGFGYTVILEERQRRKRALQNEPVAVEFATEEDYLALLERKDQAAGFKADVELILGKFPGVRDALKAKPTLVVATHGRWDGALEVVDYLAGHPRPGCHVRALPVKVPTKFIENHREAIETLLAALPATGYEANGSTFARRCGFAEDEPAIRGRFLCPVLQAKCGFPVADVSLRVGAWAALVLPTEARVVACENKTNFLALPPMPGVLALWGEGGAATGHFPRLPWLRERHVVYWGDLDPSGMMILAQLRKDHPGVRSLFMDAATLERHRDKLRDAKPAVGMIPEGRLHPEEMIAFTEVANRQGIEQEKLLFQDCLVALRQALFPEEPEG